MKIIQVVTQMEAGGAQRVAWLIHEGLLRSGYESELWFLYRRRGAYDGLPGVKTLFPRQAHVSDYPGIVATLRTWLRRERPEAVITHTHYANLLVQLVARTCGIRRRISVHHNPVQTYPWPARAGDFIAAMLQTYTTTVAVSDAVVHSMQRYPLPCRRRLVRIYNGVPPQTRSSSLSRSRWNLPAGVPLLLNVGRLARQKNQSVLMDTLLDLPEYHLVIAGAGELKEELLQRATELGVAGRLHLVGELPHHEVVQLSLQCDVFVFPSLYEAMPLALVEAMQLGLPIVASRIPANAEVLGDAGILTEPERGQLAEAIRRLRADRPLQERLTTAARKRAEGFTTDAMVRGYIDAMAAVESAA